MQSRCQGGLFQNRWSGSHYGSLSVTAMLAAVSVQSGVPHVIKTWLIFRMLLLTISTANGERERENGFQQPVHFKLTTCHPLTWWKQEVLMVIRVYFCPLEKTRNVKMWSLLTELRKGSRRPSVRGKEKLEDKELSWKTKSEKRLKERKKRALKNCKQHVDVLTHVVTDKKKKRRSEKTASLREWPSAVLRGRECVGECESSTSRLICQSRSMIDRTAQGPVPLQSLLALPVRM